LIPRAVAYIEDDDRIIIIADGENDSVSLAALAVEQDPDFFGELVVLIRQGTTARLSFQRADDLVELGEPVLAGRSVSGVRPSRSRRI
jgi:hypothetical protein